MKMKQLLLILGIMVIWFSSCEDPVSNTDYTPPNYTGINRPSPFGEPSIDADPFAGIVDPTTYGGNFPSSPESLSFWAINMEGSSQYSYTLQAKLLYEGEKCYIWGETASPVEPESAKNMALVYDRTIYPRMMDAFNSGEVFYDDDGYTVVATNPMEYASWLVDEDYVECKLTILLLDIKDGYSGAEKEGYVAGYFYSNDIRGNSNSNKRAMIYVDINPGAPEKDTTKSTLAHELQHLMNYAISQYKKRNTELWINEGLSTAAEWVWDGKQDQNRIDWYDKFSPYYDGAVHLGNNFYVWDNYSYPNAILDEYATAYLFFQWLRLQAGGPGIYKKIINSEYSDHRAVTAAAAADICSDYDNNWERLLRDWLAANFINAGTGRYGYKNIAGLRDIGPWFLIGSDDTGFQLFPGEGIYTQKKSMPPPSDIIKYASLNWTDIIVNDTEIVAGHDALLSYNIDPNRYGIPSSCYPFSTETALSLQPGTGWNKPRSLVQGSPFNGPYPISADDMLRRHRQREEKPEPDFSVFFKGKRISSDE